jgi:beta-aspartyl-peptidase (threonine type)
MQGVALVVLGMAAALSACSAPTARGSATADETDENSRILTLMRAQEAAWNRGDIAAFMELGYWRSDELSFYSGGEVSHGYDAMLARYRQNYESPGKERGKLAFSKVDVTQLAPDVAMARGRWDLDYAEKKDVGGLFTLVLRRIPEGWRIVHDHTSVD